MNLDRMARAADRVLLAVLYIAVSIAAIALMIPIARAIARALEQAQHWSSGP